MNTAALIDALKLPQNALVDRRVPKTLLLEHGAPTPADKRRIKDGIEEVQWVASLKPTTIGVPAFRDAAREYPEIAVLTVVLRAGVRTERLSELLHRAVPYPLLLLLDVGTGLFLSMAHKRWSQGEAGATVLDGCIVTADVGPASYAETTSSFLEVLSLSSQPREDLFRLYQGWIDAVHALLAAQFTGCFSLPATQERANARREALLEATKFHSEIARLRAAAAREKQLPRQIELALQMKEAEMAFSTALARL